ARAGLMVLEPFVHAFHELHLLDGVEENMRGEWQVSFAALLVAGQDADQAPRERPGADRGVFVFADGAYQHAGQRAVFADLESLAEGRVIRAGIDEATCMALQELI